MNFDNLKGLGIVLKRAIYFITCNGKYYINSNKFSFSFIETNLLIQEKRSLSTIKDYNQISLFDSLSPTKEDGIKCITGNL